MWSICFSISQSFYTDLHLKTITKNIIRIAALKRLSEIVILDMRFMQNKSFNSQIYQTLNLTVIQNKSVILNLKTILNCV